jgi:uncharacterized protein YbbC (DUF1343 family)
MRRVFAQTIFNSISEREQATLPRHVRFGWFYIMNGTDAGLEGAQEALTAALSRAVKESEAPGAVGCVGEGDRLIFLEAAGNRELTPDVLPAEKDTIYDLASLTKMIATTTSVMILHEEGRIDFDAPITEYLPIPAFGKFTVRHCLTHTAGLTAGRPFYKDCSSLNEILQVASEIDLEAPPGARRKYSDIGFMILGKVVELVGRDSLDAFARKHIFEPLEMKSTTFKPPKEWAKRCAATEKCAWRKRVIIGEVHDENAFAAGGVSGHAGLFSTAEDLSRFCRALLGGKLFSNKTLDEMTRRGQVPFYPWQGLGWKLDPWACGSEGFLPSRAAIGHTGWTGTNIWIDRDSGVFSILLSNTCHPTRGSRDTAALRRIFSEAVAERFYPGRSNVHTGIDRLLWDGFDPVRGKRIALLTNQSATDELGRSVVDVFAMAADVKIAAIYSPEHGFDVKAEAGATVKNQKGDVPIISLYGEKKRPTHEELKGVEMFVADLPDVGARYYTYMSTIFDCIEACTEANVPLMVLDRPNPVGGSILEGAIAKQTGSPVCRAALPARHGMTMGELAKFFAQTLPNDKTASVQTYDVDGWLRPLRHDQCSLPWSPPSPNIPTSETALLYVGMCLFEGTNLNEGRGTETPFYILGAPWLDAEDIVAAIAPEDRPGCVLEAARYTPKSIQGKATSPQYMNEECKGIRVTVENPEQVRAFRMAVAILAAIWKRHPKKLELKKGFDVLAGGSDLREAIIAGRAAGEIVAGYESELTAFDAQRPKLYPSAYSEKLPEIKN